MAKKKAARKLAPYDGNAAAAQVAYAVNEVIAIYPITPSSPMGEIADEKAAQGEPNIWGTVPVVVEMQAEGGAAGAVHGALTTGALTTTFTASQGLLLMIPNMYKIAGELTATVFHIAARSVAAQALSIFGDHSDVMACRGTGWGMLASNNVQEIMDLALIAHSTTLQARVPFLHFFDGFRTSHEIQKIEELTFDDMRAMIDDELVAAHRQRGLTPDRPSIRGTAQNPDVFFQGRETVNRYYLETPAIVQGAMDRFAKLVGRQYRLFDYVGAPDAERVTVMMGSGADTMHEVVDNLVAQGEKVGLVKVRLYRPFDGAAFVGALPASVRKLAVLDRTKEPGAQGEPLYLDVQNALVEASVAGAWKGPVPPVVGGRYGLGSKEFTPGMAKSVLDNLKQERPKNHFTVGIVDDVTHTSIPVDPDFDIDSEERVRAVFFGLGADGTVGANKNSIKIIGEETPNYAQGYFVYDSKKSGSITISHLRFGPNLIRAPYLIEQANFVACHQFGFLERYDMLEYAVPGGTFLLNAPFPKQEVWKNLPRKVQEQIVEKKLKLYAIDAYDVAEKTGMGGRIISIMQTCFFAISGVLPREEAIAQIKKAIEKTYGKKGAEVVRRNFASVDATLENLHEIPVGPATSAVKMRPTVPAKAPDFVRRVQAVIIEGKGDLLPVFAFPVDGTWPTATAQWEKRAIAL
ncbi:MAG TPA: pyruvate:ferredoxin (flavodoxin) oxidoreductase, partial [Anaerolineales bacterium]|nr:pyruvate:ferredoxin (flavodoxin) oxidoreductase [Anaerolineales bacterium]